MLKSCEKPLSSAYDVAVLDLDGVVYVGAAAVPGAPRALAEAATAGMRLAYVTNNAARTPEDVAGHLRSLGIDTDAHDVVTSAQAAARLLTEEVADGARIYLVGGAGLDLALRERGFVPVTDPDDEPVAVAQGYGPDMPWRRVVDGTILVGEGLPWVASNTDLTIPTSRGVGPGNGALVKLIADHTGRRPRVAGKPAPPLFEETLERVGGSHPLVVGDRLDTDIEGAGALGWDSLLVLTGVSGLGDLVAAGPGLRPSYIGQDLNALAQPHEVPEQESGVARLGGWTARVDDATLVIEGEGSADDWWRVVAVVAWSHLDATGAPVEVNDLRPPR